MLELDLSHGGNLTANVKIGQITYAAIAGLLDKARDCAKNKQHDEEDGNREQISEQNGANHTFEVNLTLYDDWCHWLRW